MNEMLDPGHVEIQYDAMGVQLVDTRDPQNTTNPGAWPRWRFTYDEWDEFAERVAAYRHGQ